MLAADKQSDAVKDATKAQTASNDAALALQKQQYDQQRADYAPWRAVGQGALQMLGRTFGIQVPADTFSTNVAPIPQYGQAATTPATATGGATPTAAQPTTTLKTPGESAGQAYFAQNPDVKAEWDRVVATGNAGNDKFQNDPEKFAAWHYQTYGAGEGRSAPTAVAPVYDTAPAAPTTPATTTPAAPVTTNTGTPVTGNGLTVTPATTAAANTGRYGDFYASPDYQFRLDEGTRAITGNAAAKGLLDSGALGKGLINYGQQSASQEFGSWFSRIATLAGYGQTAVAGTTQAGQAATSNQTGIIQNQGDNLASSITTQGGISAGMINNAGSAVGGLIQNMGRQNAIAGAKPFAEQTVYQPQAQQPWNPQGLIPTGSNLYGAVI